ncbi:MAG: hypothetical protein ABIQ18_11275 [Umezawaea sp.]
MPRRNHPKRPISADDDRPLGGGTGWARTESATDGDWQVRNVAGTQTTKHYRCPGCDHQIQPGTPHLVAWPTTDYGSVEERRHWHLACWTSRTRRPRHGY